MEDKEQINENKKEFECLKVSTTLNSSSDFSRSDYSFTQTHTNIQIYTYYILKKFFSKSKTGLQVFYIHLIDQIGQFVS